MYCAYCGKIAKIALVPKRIAVCKNFLSAVLGQALFPLWRETRYKRGVPPQIKAQERATLRKHYKAWYAALVADYGEKCAHCGSSEKLVLDHRISIAKGGLSTLDNLQILCAECNRLKGKLCFDCCSDTKLT